MTRRTVTIVNAQQGYTAMADLWLWCKSMLIDGGRRLTVEVKEEKRSDAQSRLMWSSLTDISRQVVWHGQKLDKEDWKHILTASLKKQRAVQGIDGGFVVLGTSTSSMTKAEMTELINLAHAFGAQHGVQWSPSSIAQDMEQYA